MCVDVCQTTSVAFVDCCEGDSGYITLFLTLIKVIIELRNVSVHTAYINFSIRQHSFSAQILFYFHTIFCYLLCSTFVIFEAECCSLFFFSYHIDFIKFEVKKKKMLQILFSPVALSVHRDNHFK